MTQLQKLIQTLLDLYPDTESLLDFETPYQLLIAIILSAQTTDRQVNSVTKGLFDRYPDPGALSKADSKELEEAVRPVGFFRVKARHIRESAALLEREFAGNVPDQMDELLRFPGLGRKGANVILGKCFGQPAIIVDTHFSRVVQRLGLSASSSPEKIEKELRSLIPENLQTDFSMAVNLHGRYLCRARKPLCVECSLRPFCPYPSDERLSTELR